VASTFWRDPSTHPIAASARNGCFVSFMATFYTIMLRRCTLASMADARRRKTSYLLDPRFQLKWTSYLVAVVLVVMTALGVVIARTASHASDTADVAVKQAEKAFQESRTNATLLKQMAGPDNPALAAIDDSLGELDAQFEKSLADVRSEKDGIESDRAKLRWLMIGSGAALLVLLLVMGIIITHRIVGPVHKMKRLLRRVSTGRLVVDERLRKGDELEDLFETFLQMTFSLRAMQKARIATLDATLKRAEASGAHEDVLDGMRALRAQLTLGLEKRRGSMRPAPAE
jgi:nitrogen fixation/metabolism regulation signal transduction histidine kinase